jgi:hypothetical protein
VRILDTVEIEERTHQPPFLDRPQQVGHPPPRTGTGEDHDPLMVRRCADAGQVLLRHHLKAQPRLRAVVEDRCKVPAAFFGDIDADDVPGPAGEERLAGADPVIFLLGLSLMAGGRTTRLVGD